MEKITVRHSEPEDASAIRDIYAGKNAYSGTLQLPNPSGKGWSKRMANVPDNVYSFVAELNGDVVGNLGFEVCSNARRRHVGSFGMGVKDDSLGKGVGSALVSNLIELTDNWLNIMRLELTVYTDNHAAIGLYEKFGFVIEGESKAFAFRNGQFVNVYHMARLNVPA